MPKKDIEYVVTRSFSTSENNLIEKLIEIIDEVMEDDDESNSNCGDLLQTI